MINEKYISRIRKTYKHGTSWRYFIDMHLASDSYPFTGLANLKLQLQSNISLLTILNRP